ncbi:restriction endonuclease subunit S [Saccharicrinis sp. FJH54]|uniref:restriction endonuclease subunit S n=1 Tax=Saccharicrinis sp. FJH54 TaxID=3344665 RepID=UPI0035D4A914
MRSNYKQIGDYIKLVKERNSDLKATELLGINIDKYFMPSVANVVGTDLSRYKVVKQGQFACNRMHVGRDYRIPVALSDNIKPFMVSPAYDVFEIVNTSVLAPEYLMMWFSRKEFDRNAWFYTDADVRGGLSWDAFCNLQLPIPSIEKQRQIVAEYNTVKNRIELNNQLIQKLEETAQAIYKQWFVDEINMENLPVDWNIGKLPDLLEVKYGKAYSHLEEGNIPLYGSGGLMGKVSKALYTKPSVLIPRKGTLSNVMFVNQPFWCVDTMFYSIFKNESNGYYAFFILKQLDFDALNQGSAVPSMTTAFLKDIDVILPRQNILNDFNNTIMKLFEHRENLEKENQKLSELIVLLLSKLATIKN